MVVEAERPHLLLIGAEPSLAETIVQSFQRLNPRQKIMAVVDGTESQPSLRQPYAIILSLTCTTTGGLQFLRDLRQDPALKRSVVFVWSDSSDDNDKAAAYELGVAGYVLKTVPDTTLVPFLDIYMSVVEFPPDLVVTS